MKKKKKNHAYFKMYGPLRPPYLVSPPPPPPSTIVLRDVDKRAPVRNDRARTKHARGHKKAARPQVDPALKCESSAGHAKSGALRRARDSRRGAREEVDITSAQILYARSILLVFRNCPRRRPKHRWVRSLARGFRSRAPQRRLQRRRLPPHRRHRAVRRCGRAGW